MIRLIQITTLDLEKAEFNWLEKYVLRRSHPKSIIIRVVAALWATVFLWNHDWVKAAVVVFVASFIAHAMVFTCHVNALAKTWIGKVALLQGLTPKDVYNRADCIELVGLIGVEVKFHRLK
jgi:hypothetical protein